MFYHTANECKVECSSGDQDYGDCTYHTTESSKVCSARDVEVYLLPEHVKIEKLDIASTTRCDLLLLAHSHFRRISFEKIISVT